MAIQAKQALVSTALSMWTVLIIASGGTRAQVFARGSDSNHVTIERAGRPVAEVLSDMSRVAKLSLAVSPELVAQKVTVLFRNLSVKDAMSALAAAIDGEWQTAKAADGSLVCTLVPSERRRRQLRQARAKRRKLEEQRRNVALNALFENMYKAKTSDGEGESKAVHSQSPKLLDLLSDVPRDVWQDVIQDANSPGVDGAWDTTPGLVATGGMLDRRQRTSMSAFLNQLARQIPPGSPRANVAGNLAGHPENLRLEVWASEMQDGGSTTTATFLRVLSPDGSWVQDCRLAMPVPIPPSKDGDELSESELAPAGARKSNDIDARELQINYGPARMDRAMLEIARAAGINLASDYYTKPGHADLAGRKRLARLLSELNSSVKTAHFWTGPTLVVRSRDWSSSFDREPAGSVIDRWQARTTTGKSLQYADYANAATALGDLQIGRLAAHTDEHGRRLWYQEVDLLSQNRHALRGLASLTTTQVDRMRSPDGLSVKRLSIPQARAWRAALRPLALYPAEAVASVRLRLLDRDPIPGVAVAGLPNTDSLELVRESKLPLR